jgi:hypothetical protein
LIAGQLLGGAGLDTPELRAIIHPIDPDRIALRRAPRLVMAFWRRGIDAMTIGTWIMVRPDLLGGDPARLARLAIHELVHVRQWADFGFFGFLRRYLSDYWSSRRQGQDPTNAYRAIRLEREAREVAARFS